MYNNCTVVYDELLALDNKLKSHLQFLAIETYKSRNKFNASFMRKAYVEKNIPYLLRRGVPLLIIDENTRKHWINSLKFGGNILWNSLPADFKECQSLLEIRLLLVEACYTLAQHVEVKTYFIFLLVHTLKFTFWIIVCNVYWLDYISYD